MAPETGLKMTHSNQIDPYRKVCSASTIQSDPNGYFAKIIDELKEKNNFENVLLQVRNLSLILATRLLGLELGRVS